MHHLLGAMSRKLAIVKRGKYVHVVVFFWHHLLGAMLRKLAIFKARKYVHSTIFCTTSNENLNTRLDMLHITTLFVGKSKNAWSKSSKNLLNRIDNMEQVFQGGARFCIGAILNRIRRKKIQIFRSFVCGGDLDEKVNFLLFDKQKFSTSCFRSKPPFSHQHTRIRNVLLPTTLPFQIVWDYGVKYFRQTWFILDNTCETHANI